MSTELSSHYHTISQRNNNVMDWFQITRHKLWMVSQVNYFTTLFVGGGLQVADSFGLWFTWCQSCRHGGHANHIAQWFRWARCLGWFPNRITSSLHHCSCHKECPVTGCSCNCYSLDSGSSDVLSWCIVLTCVNLIADESNRSVISGYYACSRARTYTQAAAHAQNGSL